MAVVYQLSPELLAFDPLFTLSRLDIGVCLQHSSFLSMMYTISPVSRKNHWVAEPWSRLS